MTYDIGRHRGKTNLAVVSIAGACEYTFGHELGGEILIIQMLELNCLGHLFGLAHQKDGNQDENDYFSYGHGFRISRKKGNKEGTRTVMATASGGYKHRLNLYSNPMQGTGTSDSADNARVLR